MKETLLGSRQWVFALGGQSYPRFLWQEGRTEPETRAGGRSPLLRNNTGARAQRRVIAANGDPARGSQHASSQGLCPHPVPCPCARLPAEIRGRNAAAK